MIKLMFRVTETGLVPADRFALEAFRKGYKAGKIVVGRISSPRNPKFNGLVHKLGALVSENIEGFEHLKGHDVLKRLQRESLTECEEFTFKLQGMLITQLIPKSLSFESMDEETFSNFYKRICAYIVKTYWPTETTERVMQMAELMDDC